MTPNVVEARHSIEYIERTYPGKNIKYVSANTISQHIGRHINVLVADIIAINRTVYMLKTTHPVPAIRDRLIETHTKTIDDCAAMINIILKRFYGQRRVLSGLDMFWFIKEFQRY